MSNDPFTSDMFGSSVLSSGLGLGVTAFGGFSPDAANDDDPDPLPPAPAPALPVAATPVRRARLRANFYLDGDRKLAASWKDRARANVAAILVADGIAKQDRPATANGGQNKVCSKSCAKLERTLNITRRGGFFWQVARA